MSGKNLTSGRTLARNSIINFIGQFLPMVVAFFSIPFLIHGVGTARFGIITLIWMVIGYFSLFDFGLGRALTQMVAEKLGKADEGEIPATVWTVLLIMFALAALGGGLIFVFSHWLCDVALKIPQNLQAESITAMHIISFTLPAVLLTSALGGFLMALQKFGALNAIKVPSGFFNYIGPLLVLPFSHSLVWVTAVIAFGRIVTCLAHVIVCIKVYPALRVKNPINLSYIPRLLRYGGWMTVSNIISPLMVQMDRFVIGAAISVTAVAYYATPYEVLNRLLVVPCALGAVVFPAFASSYLVDRSRTRTLLVRSTKVIGLVMFAILLFVNCFAHEFLYLWVGNDFAIHSTKVMQILAVGIFCNGVASIFFAFIQGVARPDLTAKLHMVELPIYLAILWFTIHRFGIVGAAIAWTCRVALDCALLLWLSDKFMTAKRFMLMRVGSMITLSAVLLFLPMLLPWLWARVPLFVIIAALCITVGYRILDEEERNMLISIVRKRLKIGAANT